MNKPLLIRERFHKAGIVHNWDTVFFGCEGVGINIELFDGVGYARVRVEDPDKVYHIPKMDARRFIKAHGSIDLIRGVEVWVLPFNLIKYWDKVYCGGECVNG